MTTKKIILSALLFVFALGSFAQKYTLSGYVKDSSSGEALGNAFISTTLNGKFVDAYPNAYGFYSMSLPAGTYKVKFSMPGFISGIINITVSANTTVNMNLVKKVTTVKTVTVKGNKEGEDVEKTEMSVNKLSIGQIKRIPALLGEVDVVRSLQLLPGVSTAG